MSIERCIQVPYIPGIFTVEVDHTITSTLIDEIETFDIFDIDDDGEDEFIIVSSDRLFILNSQDFSIEWSSLMTTAGGDWQNTFLGVM